MSSVFNNIRVLGNLDVKGTTTSVDSTIVNIADNFLYLNKDLTTGSKSGGITINYNASGITATTAGGVGFTAGTVDVVTGQAWSANDFIQVSGALNSENNGLYQIISVDLNTPPGFDRITVTGGSPSDYVQTSFTENATDVTATVTKVSIAVIQTSDRGVLQYGAADNAGLISIDPIITESERTAIGNNTIKTQNITATSGITEFTGEVSVDNPHENYITTIDSVGTPAAVYTGGLALQVGMVFTPTKDIKMTKLYIPERNFLVIDNLPRVSIFGTSTTVPLIVFDVDETTKFTPDLPAGSYGYYVKDIQFEFQAGVQYSIQTDIYTGNSGADPNIKTYPAVLGINSTWATLYNTYGKVGGSSFAYQWGFFDCEDNDYTNHYTSSGNNLSKDIYGAGGVLDKITVRASNMLYNMKNTAQTFEYPDGIGYKSMFYNPSIGEICYSSKEVVNDFYYVLNADTPDFHKDNMLIFSWTNSTGTLQVRSTGALPTGMYVNSCIIGGTTVWTTQMIISAATYDVYSGGIPNESRLDAFIAPNSVQPGLMPSYHIIAYRTGAASTIWIKRIQNNT